MKNGEIIKYSFAEELMNSISHWIGVVAGIVGLVFLIVLSLGKGALRISSLSIYGGCFIAMFLSSALYHTIQNKTAKSILRVFDHSSIFLFIGGTYVPIIMLSFDGRERIILIFLVGALVLGGILFKIFTYGKFEKYKKLSLAFYLCFGWLSLFLLKHLYFNTSHILILFLVLGGLAYSLGSIFYAIKKIPFNHGIWHLFVLAGAVLQYLGLLFTYCLGW